MFVRNSRLVFVLVILQILVSLSLSSPTRKGDYSTLHRSSNPKLALKCSTDQDCDDLLLCTDNRTNCYCNQNTSHCDWIDRAIRPRWRRSVADISVQLAQDDIGPDTCGKDRKLLSNWFLTHGSPDLLKDPIPENVLPTFPNPYDDPNKPPLQPDEVSGMSRKNNSFTMVKY